MADTVQRLYQKIREDFEYCYNVALSAPLAPEDWEKLRLLLGDGSVPGTIGGAPYLSGPRVDEVGPRMNFETAWSTNLVSICRAIHLETPWRASSAPAAGSSRRGRIRGEGSEVRGMGAYGLFVDHASGLHVYRNIAYNNAYTGYLLYGVWRDGQMVYVNNVAANSLYGMSLGGAQYDTHAAVDTQVINNILVNNEAFGLSMGYAEGLYTNTNVDYNLYYTMAGGPTSRLASGTPVRW